MKKFLIMAAMVLSSAGAFAQYSGGEFTIQPKIGLNVSNLSNYDDSDYKAGLVAGVEAEYHINNWFAISGGLLYSQQGADYTNKSNHFQSKFTTKLDYLNIPILANFYVAKGLSLKAGVQPGFLLSAKNDNTSIKAVCEDFDFAIPVGISYEYKGFCLDARFTPSVTSVFNNDGRDYSDKAKNEVFSMTFGYKFKL